MHFSSMRIAAALCGALCSQMPHAVAQTFPSKNVRILVGAPPGGSNDIFARAIGQRMSPSLGQPVIVDNRPGANQLIAADLLAKAPPDGHTLYITTTSFAAGVAIQPEAAFRSRERSHRRHDGRQRADGARRASVAAREERERPRRDRARETGPAQLHVVGHRQHQPHGDGSVQVGRRRSTSVHIPHKGMSPALTDLMAGNVQILIVSLPSVDRTDEVGTVARARRHQREAHDASCPSCRRSRSPACPVTRATLWWGIFAPSKTPKPIIDRLNAEIHKAMATAGDEEDFRRFRRGACADDAGRIQRDGEEGDREVERRW